MGIVLELGRTLWVEEMGQVVKVPMVLEEQLPKALLAQPLVSVLEWSMAQGVDMAC